MMSIWRADVCRLGQAAVLALGLTWAAGCQERRAGIPARHRAQPTIAGKYARPTLGPMIRAYAIINTYDEKRQVYANRYRLRIEPWDRLITAEAREGIGGWRAVVDDLGRCRLTVSGMTVGRGERAKIAWMFTMLLRRIRDAVKPRGRPGRAGKQIRLGGMDVIRVDVAARRPGPRRPGRLPTYLGLEAGPAVAYYFEAKTKLLRFATVEGDKAGDHGTVTKFGDYSELARGLRMPRTIGVVRIGRRVLIGQAPVLEARLSDVVLVKRR